MTVRILVNLGPNGELGNEGKTIYNNPLDFQLFKLITCVDRSVVIAGRRTAESMKHVSRNGRELLYVSNSQTTTIGKYGQWKHLDDVTSFLNADKTHIDEQVYIVGGAGLIETVQDQVEEAIIMHDDTFSYWPCDTYWNPSEYFFRDGLLFKQDSLSCYRWMKR